MFLSIKSLHIQMKKGMTTCASLYEGPIFYFSVFTFMQELIMFISIPLLIILHLESIMW